MLAIITVSIFIAIACCKHTGTCVCGNYGVKKKKNKQKNGNEGSNMFSKQDMLLVEREKTKERIHTATHIYLILCYCYVNRRLQETFARLTYTFFVKNLYIFPVSES